jgi:nitrogen fixation/metabolism regulation signal transduction histidine kinase
MAWTPFRKKSGKAADHGDAPKVDVHQQIALTIADSNPDAVLFFSDAGAIRYANPVARELFFEGRDPEGQNFLKLLSTAPVALREALLGESDRLFSVEIDGQHETYHVSRRTFAMHGELHTLLIVKHLTREIGRREVEVLKKVIRIISHEVNNSLAPISSLVHSARLIAKNPQHTDKLERVFDTIHERASHLQTFLESYASIARLPRPRPVRIDWKPFLRQVQELHPDIVVGEPPAVQGFFDPVQVEQVVINIIKNAREACSPAGATELVVSTEPSGASELKLLDKGPGFSEKALQNAVLPLYTTKARGSGMGLALSREIIEAHGGSLGIANRPEGGAAITVRLPGPNPEEGRLSRSRLTLTRS